MLAYRSYEPNRFLFFNNVTPIGVTTIRRHFNYYIRKVGLPRITTHGIRHSNNTWLLSDELNLEKISYVSKRLGHASIKEPLDVYMHIYKKENPIILQELDDLVFNNPKANTYSKMI